MKRFKKISLIAELDGWKFSEIKTKECFLPVLLNGKEAYVNFSLPDYLGCIKEAVRLEKSVIPKEKRALYLVVLSSVTGNEGVFTNEEKLDEAAEYLWKVHAASAEDRIDAILITLNKMKLSRKKPNDHPRRRQED